jgi:hypothetical protein
MCVSGNILVAIHGSDGFGKQKWNAHVITAVIGIM